MDSPIGAPIELPERLLTGSNQQYLIKYDTHDDNLCFWRCSAFSIHKPDINRRVEKHIIDLFDEYYENKTDIKNMMVFHALIIRIMMKKMKNLW